jgi:O-antigen ligase/tetratricopeptide (TPR) repeat protein
MSKKKKFPKTLLILTILALFTPLVLIPELWMGNQSATFLIFCVLVELSLPLYLYHILKHPEDRPNLKNTVLRFFALFLAIYFISSLAGIDFSLSFWGSGMRNIGHFLQLHTLAYILFLALLLERMRAKGFNLLLGSVAIVGGIAALYGCLEYIGIIPTYAPNYLPRASSVFGNPTLFGSFLTIPFFFSLLSSLRSDKKHFIWSFQILTFIIFLGVLASGARGALLGILVGLVAGLIARAIKEQNEELKKKIVSAAILLVIISSSAFGLIYYNSTEGSTAHRLTHFSSNTSSERLVQWSMAMDGWVDEPILGRGYENFYQISDSNFDTDLYLYSSIWPDKPHNLFLEVLSTGGTLTALAFLGLIAFMFKAFWTIPKRKRFTATDSSLLIAAFTSYLIQSIFLFETVASGITFAVLVALAIFVDKRPHSKKIKPASTVPFQKTVPALVLLGALILITLIHRPIALDLYHADQMTDHAPENWELAIEHTKKIGTYGFEYDADIAATNARTLVTEVFADPNTTQEIREEMTDLMLKHNQRLVETYPLRASHWYRYLYAKLTTSQYLNQEINIETFRTELDTFTTLAPKRVETLPLQTRLAKEYFDVGENETAIEYMKHLEAEYGIQTYQDYLFGVISQYLGEENLQQTAILFELMLEDYPEDPQLYASLATTYIQLEEYEKAIETTERLLEIDEGFQEQVDWFMENAIPQN